MSYTTIGYRIHILMKQQKKNCAPSQMMKRRSKTAFIVNWNLVRADSVVSLEQGQTV